ncbi:uncharacterized protein LOC111907736 [Lactuca sativa]|uniref:uncharacterized protein LOC111907736 n=1 Tax=Lactuca sativa TaxID=4236 RepID=UPI000CD9AA82|nr:uncharacterized protein LOC111907736 [Lactuca sativa]
MADFHHLGDLYFPNHGNNGWLKEESEEEAEEDPEEESEEELEVEVEGGPTDPVVDLEEEEAEEDPEGESEEELGDDDDGNVIAANPESFHNTKRLAKKLYDQNNKRGEKVGEAESKKECDNKKGKNNKRKGQQGSESSKKQQIVTVDAATTQVPSTPHAPTSSTPSAPKQYSGNLPKCNKCNLHHNGKCR